MKQPKLNPNVYLLAAEIMATDPEVRYSCVAIDEATAVMEVDDSDLHYVIYQKMFGPWKDDPLIKRCGTYHFSRRPAIVEHPYWDVDCFGRDDFGKIHDSTHEERHEMRVLALLFMHEMAKENKAEFFLT